MTETGILTAAITYYGERLQEEVAVEELSELTQAIIHKHRGRDHNIAEEIADVEIMLAQLKIINLCADEVADIKKDKLESLKLDILEKNG